MTNLPSALNIRIPRQRRGGRHRYPLLVVPLVAVAGLTAAACGSSQSSPTTTGASTATTGASAASLRLASSTLPSVGSVLTGPNGRTLYYFTTDTSSATTCTGQCAVVWPPLVVPAGTKPTLSSGVSGERVHGQPAGRDDPGRLPGSPSSTTTTATPPPEWTRARGSTVPGSCSARPVRRRAAARHQRRPREGVEVASGSSVLVDPLRVEASPDPGPPGRGPGPGRPRRVYLPAVAIAVAAGALIGVGWADGWGGAGFADSMIGLRVVLVGPADPGRPGGPPRSRAVRPAQRRPLVRPRSSTGRALHAPRTPRSWHPSWWRSPSPSPTWRSAPAVDRAARGRIGPALGGHRADLRGDGRVQLVGAPRQPPHPGAVAVPRAPPLPGGHERAHRLPHPSPHPRVLPDRPRPGDRAPGQRGRCRRSCWSPTPGSSRSSTRTRTSASDPWSGSS